MGDKKELLVTKSGNGISVTLNGNGLDLLELFAAATTALLKTRAPVEALHSIIDIAPYDGNTAELVKELSMPKFKGDFHDDKDVDDIDLSDDLELGEDEVAITKERMVELGQKILKEHINKLDNMIEDKDLDKDKVAMATLMKIKDTVVIMETVEKLTNAVFEEEDASDERPS